MMGLTRSYKTAFSRVIIHNEPKDRGALKRHFSAVVTHVTVKLHDFTQHIVLWQPPNTAPTPTTVKCVTDSQLDFPEIR